MADSVRSGVVEDKGFSTRLVWESHGQDVFLQVRGWVSVETLERLLSEIKSRV